MSSLDISNIVVYAILVNPVLYCMWKHGRSGILGWLPLQIFCILRIVGSALAIHNAAVHSTSQNSLIFSNIGLSPLLLAAVGILHEARTARNPNINSKVEWFRVIIYHVNIIGMMVLVILGVIKQINDAPHTPNILMKVGVIGLLVSWNILIIWAVVSWFRAPNNISRNPVYVDGKTLLFGVLVGLPFIGLRDVYALLSVFIGNSNFKNNIPAKVVMSVVPEMICTMVFTLVGIQTRKIASLRNTVKA